MSFHSDELPLWLRPNNPNKPNKGPRSRGRVNQREQTCSRRVTYRLDSPAPTFFHSPNLSPTSLSANNMVIAFHLCYFVILGSGGKRHYRKTRLRIEVGPSVYPLVSFLCLRTCTGHGSDGRVVHQRPTDDPRPPLCFEPLDLHATVPDAPARDC